MRTWQRRGDTAAATLRWRQQAAGAGSVREKLKVACSASQDTALCYVSSSLPKMVDVTD